MITKPLLTQLGRANTNTRTSYREGDQWWLRALCRNYDPDLWFPSADRANAYSFPRKVCRQCPVQRQCLEDALPRHHKYGMFGGLTPGEMKKLRASRESQCATDESICA